MQKFIEDIWNDRALLSHSLSQDVVRDTIAMLDKGEIRVAEKVNDEWVVNEWMKKAILLYFGIQKNVPIEVGPFEFFDKIETKKGFENQQVRVVPQAIARYGSYLAPNTILMPSYVNIGAYVDSGTMVDTWATVGSCAQIGKNVHLIGGVLEPLQAAPVIIEDECFIGSRAIVVEGVRVKRGAVLGANVVITGSSKIIDVTGPEPIEIRGYVPENAIVIPGTIPKKYPAGEFQVSCALIVGKRNEKTDLKTSLNDALRTVNNY